MTVNSIDTYIQDSVRLLKVAPSTSTITITYKTIENKNDTTTDKKNIENKSSVSFKTKNSQSSTSYTFSTNKSKDLSRLLSALGPRGVTINLSSPLEKKAFSNGKNKKKKITKKNNSHLVGVSSILANKYIPNEEERINKLKKNKQNTSKDNGQKGSNDSTTPISQQQQQPPSSGKNKKKNKKSKKKH